MSHLAYLDSLQHQKRTLADKKIHLSGIRNLYREHFLLWMFLSREGLWEEAREFLHDNEEEPVPLEWLV